MKILTNKIGTIKSALKIFFGLVCVLMSCNNPLYDKAQKILESHPTIISKIRPDYYLNLFQQKVRDKIKLTTSLEHIDRDTVCNFLYDGKYYITMYTLSRSFNISLQNSLKENVNPNHEELGTAFYENELGSVYIENRVIVTDNDKPLNIYISFNGSELSKKIKNDSIVDYFFKCKSLSIKFKINGHQEVYVTTDKSIKQNVPIETIFLKSKKRLFLIFLTPKKDFAALPPELGKMLFNFQSDR